MPSALIVGTFAPDFEYFLRLAPKGGFGHTLSGAFLLSLPVALLVLWLFHTCVKEVAVSLLPSGFQARLVRYLGRFQFSGAARFLLIVVSVLLGIGTHILWDSFTHPNTWADRHWPFFRQKLHLPIVGDVPHYSLFQHGSTLIGVGVLAAWIVYWYRATMPDSLLPIRSLTSAQKLSKILFLSALALAGTFIRVMLGMGLPIALIGNFKFKMFVGDAVVTWMALIWWQLVVYGLFLSKERQAETELPVAMG